MKFLNNARALLLLSLSIQLVILRRTTILRHCLRSDMQQSCKDILTQEFNYFDTLKPIRDGFHGGGTSNSGVVMSPLCSKYINA